MEAKISYATTQSGILQDKEEINMKTYNFTINNKNYEGRVLKQVNNTLTIELNGTEYSVTLADTMPVTQETRNEKPGQSNVPSGQKSLKAPLPGTIIDIKVNEGDNVKERDILFILEAMKMESEISSPYSGIVKKINISKGDTVLENDILIVFE